MNADGSEGCIRLRGVAVHNLKSIDLDLPRERLIVVCGVSGSGKSSLAMDTLFAEGQRRYIESFSAYSRQFLAKLARPQAQLIDGIPPALAISQRTSLTSRHGTLGSATEISDYLRLLYAKIATPHCPRCKRVLHRWTSDEAARLAQHLPSGSRCLVGYEVRRGTNQTWEEILDRHREAGYVRWLFGDTTRIVDRSQEVLAPNHELGHAYLILDRLMAGDQGQARWREAFEGALSRDEGRADLFVHSNPPPEIDALGPGVERPIDGTMWRHFALHRDLACDACGETLPLPEPMLFHPRHGLGACPTCEGTGIVWDFDLRLTIPDINKSLSEGPVACWNSPAYRQQQVALLAWASAAGVAIHVPYRDLPSDQRRALELGDPARQWPGIAGFLDSLRDDMKNAPGKSDMHKFLAQWQREVPCPVCEGSRLRPAARAFHLGGLSIDALSASPVSEILRQLRAFRTDSTAAETVAKPLLDQVASRLGYLEFVGLGYLTLDDRVATLSSGEQQRVALTATLGSTLVNMLYVLDEPSSGLHPHDLGSVIKAIRFLRDRGNTVVVVEHEEQIIRSADFVVEIGPAAGESGGEVTFAGTPRDLLTASESITGPYLTGQRGRSVSDERRTRRGAIRLIDARGQNLKNLTVEFPLGVLSVVCGVSGSGKSALVERTLFPAICRRKRKKSALPPLPYLDVTGDGAIDDVILVDQTSIGKTPRSNPVTFIKAFDEIRRVFSETIAAKMRNLSPSYFSFNVDEGGRCETCTGDGTLSVDMQFLAEVQIRCPDCEGHRYRRDALDVRYRGKNIADILEMTAREAIVFFRGQVKVQSRLQRLMDVGLDYVRLGQPANSLSAGESQRLKLASHLGSTRRARVLFILDEPTRGLHFQDVVKLLDCFDSLLNEGHSLIVVEHNAQILRAADFLVELGPGASADGGAVIFAGTPEEMLQGGSSPTARFLRDFP